MTFPRHILMALAVEIMETYHRSHTTARSALDELGAPPRPGRAPTWEDVVGAIFAILQRENDRPTLPAGEPACVAIVRLAPRGKRPVRKAIATAQKIPGPADITPPSRSQLMAGRA